MGRTMTSRKPDSPANAANQLSVLTESMKQFLRGEVSGRVVVKKIDDFVSDDCSYELPDDLNQAFVQFKAFSAS